MKDYEQTLLEGWEENHKKSQLTLWVLLALKDSPKHMKQIKEFIEERTFGTITADDKSMYRALRRFNEADLVNLRIKPTKGPDLKIYFLVDTGKRVLNLFVKRNIKAVWFSKENHDLLKD